MGTEIREVSAGEEREEVERARSTGSEGEEVERARSTGSEGEGVEFVEGDTAAPVGFTIGFQSVVAAFNRSIDTS